MAALAPVRIAREGDNKCVDMRSSKNQGNLVTPAVRNEKKLRCCRSSRTCSPHDKLTNAKRVKLTRGFSKLSATMAIAAMLAFAMCVAGNGGDENSASTKTDETMKKWKYTGTNPFRRFMKFMFRGRDGKPKLSSCLKVVACLLSIFLIIFAITFDATGIFGARAGENLMNDKGASRVARVVMIGLSSCFLLLNTFCAIHRYNETQKYNNEEEYKTEIAKSKNPFKKDPMWAYSAIFFSLCILCCGGLLIYLITQQGDNWTNMPFKIAFWTPLVIGIIGLCNIWYRVKANTWKTRITKTEEQLSEVNDKVNKLDSLLEMLQKHKGAAASPDTGDSGVSITAELKSKIRRLLEQSARK